MEFQQIPTGEFEKGYSVARVRQPPSRFKIRPKDGRQKKSHHKIVLYVKTIYSSMR